MKRQQASLSGWFRAVWISACTMLLLFSYTQVDLSLTLSRASLIQTIQKAFQHIGFFQRPAASVLFIIIYAALFGLYLYALRIIRTRGSSIQEILTIALLTSGVLYFSYPAFSYDYYNYLFTAKTVLVYHKNPYTVIPLDFAGVEPWLSFMRWTHLPSAYTPVWIGITLPFYILGFGYLLALIWSLKFVFVVSYLGSVWAIGQILKDKTPHLAPLGMAIFALNPLVITEALASPHNDILMMAIALFAMVAYSKKSKWLSFFTLAVSVSVKLMTIFLIPAFFMEWNRKFALAGMVFGFLLVLMQREVLPWYYLWIIPFVSLLPDSRWITTISTGVSAGLIFRYLPYIYLGHWNDPAPVLKLWFTAIPIIFSVVIVLYRNITRRPGVVK